MIKRKSKHEFLVTVPNREPVTEDDIKELKEWCTEFFGPGGRNKHCRWRYGWTDRISDNFYFKSEGDAVMFAMRCP